MEAVAIWLEVFALTACSGQRRPAADTAAEFATTTPMGQ